MKKDASSFDVVIAGVGGQGVLVLTKILGNAALREGLNAISSELHGMAQRGGVVTSFVRIGRDIYASTVADGLADAILALEPAEALRMLRYVNQTTLMIISRTPIPPPLAVYPPLDSISKECHKATERVMMVDDVRLAEKAGSRRAQNMVMLGCLAGAIHLPMGLDSLKDGIREMFPEKLVKTNLEAFELGCRFSKRVIKAPAVG